MAYKSKFLHFKTKASYEAERAKTTAGTEERKVFDAYISFIDEGPMICTWGKEYKCDISASEVEALVNAGKISPATVAPLIAGTAAVGTSIKYAREDHRHPAQTTVSGNAGTATKLATSRVIAIAGAVSGSATFDGSSNVSINSTLNGFDASKITSGTLNADRLPEIPISKIPAAAMERLYVVESQSAAMSLTIQEGDVVQIGSGGPMYFCVSESASTFATKFKVFTAGAATSVPWSGVTGAPTKLSQFTNDSGFITSVPAQSWSSITGKPTTLDGYGITDAIKNTTTATATTLAAGASATAVYDKATNKFTFGIPRGATGPAGTYTAGSGISISGNTISADIPVALPNPYALTINGQSYTGSSAVSVTTSKPLTSGGNTSGTVVAGRNYNATSSSISSVSGFSYDNPDAVVGSSTKITSFPSSVRKMDGIADLSGSYYVYCFSYIGGYVYVNGAVYA